MSPWDARVASVALVLLLPWRKVTWWPESGLQMVKNHLETTQTPMVCLQMRKETYKYKKIMLHPHSDTDSTKKLSRQSASRPLEKTLLLIILLEILSTRPTVQSWRHLLFASSFSVQRRPQHCWRLGKHVYSLEPSWLQGRKDRAETDPHFTTANLPEAGGKSPRLEHLSTQKSMDIDVGIGFDIDIMI